MNNQVDVLKRIAEEAKALYRRNVITREAAKKDIMPYIEAFNKRSAEIAKKYDQEPMKITFAKYVR